MRDQGLGCLFSLAVVVISVFLTLLLVGLLSGISTLSYPDGPLPQEVAFPL